MQKKYEVTTQNIGDLGNLIGETLRKAWHTCGNPLHDEADFYPLLGQVGKEAKAREDIYRVVTEDRVPSESLCRFSVPLLAGDIPLIGVIGRFGDELTAYCLHDAPAISARLHEFVEKHATDQALSSLPP
jgi:hypothetical protein